MDICFKNKYYKSKYFRTEEKCPFNSENLVEAGSVGPHGGWKYDENLIRTQHVAFDDGFARRIVQYVTSKGRSITSQCWSSCLCIKSKKVYVTSQNRSYSL